MGGVGSGRPSNYTRVVESTKRIDIRYMRRQCLLKPGLSGNLNWSRNGELTASVAFTVGSDQVTISYRYRNRLSASDWQDIERHIRLSETPCHYGGARQWFLCPRCNRRCEVLCGADKYFLCRQCYRLPYQTQLENEHGRACIKRNKLHDKLKSSYRRPLWGKSRERLLERYLAADVEANRALITCCEKLGIRL